MNSEEARLREIQFAQCAAELRKGINPNANIAHLAYLNAPRSLYKKYEIEFALEYIDVPEEDCVVKEENVASPEEKEREEKFQRSREKVLRNKSQQEAERRKAIVIDLFACPTKPEQKPQNNLLVSKVDKPSTSKIPRKNAVTTGKAKKQRPTPFMAKCEREALRIHSQYVRVPKL